MKYSLKYKPKCIAMEMAGGARGSDEKPISSHYSKVGKN